MLAFSRCAAPGPEPVPEPFWDGYHHQDTAWIRRTGTEGATRRDRRRAARSSTAFRIVRKAFFVGAITEKQVIANKTLRHQEKQAILVKGTLVPW